MKKLTLFFLAIALSSCVSKKLDEELREKVGANAAKYFRQDYDETKLVDVFVVTNRSVKSKNFSCDASGFSSSTDKDLRYGLCKINVPKNHNVGELKSVQNSRQSSNDFFKIIEAKPSSAQDLARVLSGSNFTPLVFVHGFNVAYDEAVLRAAQIAYDLKYPGNIVLFTWPAGASGGGFFEDKMLNKTYEDNAINAKESIDDFKKFLDELAKNDVKINLMVHSMGHQVVLPALKFFGEQNPKKPLINKLFLNAPDFSVAGFRDVLPGVKKAAKDITLYCSSVDKAISASQVFNKENRLGACANFDSVEVINVMAIDDPTFGLGHGYYSSRAILSDMFASLMGLDAKTRLFIYKSEINAPEKYFLRR